MSAKIKLRPAGVSLPGSPEQPPQPHDVANLLGAANLVARRARVAPPATVPASAHARHHVGRHAQA